MTVSIFPRNDGESVKIPPESKRTRRVIAQFIQRAGYRC